MTELFNGRWKIDFTESKVWDAERQSYVADDAGEELITITVKDGVQDYAVLYGDNPIIRLGYTARYDAPEWVPYLVRDIIVPEDQDVAAAIMEFQKRTKSDSGVNARRFEVGKPYGFLRIALVDQRTHYRINRAEDGTAQYVMMRRMADDGRSYLATIMDITGVVFRVRRFLRIE